MSNVSIITTLILTDASTAKPSPLQAQFSNVAASTVNKWVNTGVIDYVDAGGARTIIPLSNVARLTVSAPAA